MPPTLLLPHHLSHAAVTSFTTSEYLSDLKWIPSCCSSFPWPKECAHAAPTLSSSCMWLQSFALLQQDTHPHPRSHPSIQSALVFVQYRKVKRRLHLKKSHIKNRTNERQHTDPISKIQKPERTQNKPKRIVQQEHKKKQENKSESLGDEKIFYLKKDIHCEKESSSVSMSCCSGIFFLAEKKKCISQKKDLRMNEHTLSLSLVDLLVIRTNERTNEQNWIHKTQNELKQFLWDYLKQSHPYSHPNLIHY